MRSRPALGLGAIAVPAIPAAGFEPGGVMAAFGLDRAPAMVATGAFASRLRQNTRHPRFRRVAGIIAIGLGPWTALAPIIMQMSAGDSMH